MDTKTSIGGLSAAPTASSSKFGLAFYLCALLMVVITLHRGASGPTQTPTSADAGNTFELVPDRLHKPEEPAVSPNLNASVGNISLEQSVSQSQTLRLPGKKTIALQQHSVYTSPLRSWVAEQPLIQPNRKLGMSRPKWRDPEYVSLQQRYGLNPSEKIYTVMFDPGHGGSDPGAIGHNGLLEKEITLDIARRAALFLSEVPNVRVQLTRQSDRGMSRAARVAEIKNSNSDIVVSLHLNHLPQTELTLVETFYAGPDNIRESQLKQAEQAGRGNLLKTSNQHTHDLHFTKQSRSLAQIMQERVYDEVRLTNENAHSAGVKQDTLFVLTRSFTPGALIELTCLSNIEEADRLDTDEYRNRLAAALADGIRDYVEIASTAESI